MDKLSEEPGEYNVQNLVKKLKSSDQKIPIPLDPSYGGTLTEDDHALFNAVVQLCKESELFAVPPFVRHEGEGVYEYSNLFFQREIEEHSINETTEPHSKEYAHFLKRLDSVSASKLREQWVGASKKILSEFDSFFHEEKVEISTDTNELKRKRDPK